MRSRKSFWAKTQKIKRRARMINHFFIFCIMDHHHPSYNFHDRQHLHVRVDYSNVSFNWRVLSSSVHQKAVMIRFHFSRHSHGLKLKVSWYDLHWHALLLHSYELLQSHGLLHPYDFGSFHFLRWILRGSYLILTWWGYFLSWFYHFHQ